MSTRTPFSEFVLPRADQLSAAVPRVPPTKRKKAVRGPIPAELPLEKIVAVIDTREQLPHDLAPLAMVSDTLKAGDYSVRGLENIVAIERKSLPDFLACVGVERTRFEACVQRLLAYPTRAIVIETSWECLEQGKSYTHDWRSKIGAEAAMSSVLSWIARGVPVILAGDRRGATNCVRGLLVQAAQRRWRESRELITAAERVENEEVKT